MAKGRVRRVIDGDTFELWGGQRVRIADVYAPEMKQRGGFAAKRRLQSWIDRGSVVGLSNPVAYSYGRTVRYVTIDGTPLEDVL